MLNCSDRGAMTEPQSRSLRLRLAGDCLRAGGIVAHPTEGVWGLACDSNNPQAIHRLMLLKSRPEAQGFVMIAAEISQFADILDRLADELQHRLRRSWPGPVSWVVPCDRSVPVWIRGDHRTTVALRVTAHPLAAALCRAAGMRLVSTSANVHGRPPARNVLQVRRCFGAAVDLYLHGELGAARGPSEIRELLSGRVLRGG